MYALAHRLGVAGLLVSAMGLLGACSSSPDPDPGGRALKAIKHVAVALPPAESRRHSQQMFSEPHRDRCTTSDQSGFDPATALWTFDTSWSDARVGSYASGVLASSGWTALSTAPTHLVWKKKINNLVVTAKLYGGSSTTDASADWSLMATSPSQVKPLGDCL